MANKPHLGNAKITFKNNINASGPNAPMEYQASSWLTFNNGWDDANNRPYPLTDQQQAVIDQLHQQMAQAGVQVQTTIKQKVGQDSRAWPVAGRFNQFVNKIDDQAPQQQAPQQSYGGNDAW
jgi:hypothetical protein